MFIEKIPKYLTQHMHVSVPFIYTKNTKQVEVANYKCNESYQHCFDPAIDRRPDRCVIISWNNERIHRIPTLYRGMWLLIHAGIKIYP